MTTHVIIPHYGAQDVVAPTLEALGRQAGGHPVELHVIDSNPPRENLYFTRAVNIGLSFVGREDTAWVLNNDAVPDPGCLDAMLRALRQRRQAGIIGAINISKTDPDRVTWGGSGPCWPSGQHLCGSIRERGMPTAGEQEWIAFASVLLSGRMVHQVGILDENMRHVCSDSDYCLRARWAGWRCYSEPEAVVRHDFGSSHRPGPEMAQIMAADTGWFQAKWVNGPLQHMTRFWPPK